MGNISYRGNLKTASFPLLSELHGRTVIVKQQDQNYIPGLAAKESIDSSFGVPQLYYAHNVVPTDAGYKSVGYTEYAAAVFAETLQLSGAITIRDGAGNSAILVTSVTGNTYVMEAGSSSWAMPAGAPTAPGKRVTAAFVSGVTYIWYENTGCYVYDFTLGSMSPVTLAGLTAADIIGVVGNSGYLIAYSADSVAWSSVLDATDFVPSLSTGAGGGQVEGLRGTVITVAEVFGGFLVFATGNAVAGVASGNSRYPYNFTQITGAGGITSHEHVAQDTGSGSVYAYTTSGVQTVTVRSAAVVFPELTDFLSGAVFEDFNEATNELETINAPGQQIQKRLVVIADRYLLVSYGVSSLTHALLYDLSYKQFGRLKIAHTDCFEFIAYPAGTTEIPKKSIGFLQATGAIKILDADISSATSNGVMILGKFQYVRSRMMQLQAVDFENVNQGDTFALYDMPSLDGKNLGTPIAGYPAAAVGKLRVYSFHNTALNHSILCKGAFNAVSIMLRFFTAGSR